MLAVLEAFYHNFDDSVDKLKQPKIDYVSVELALLPTGDVYLTLSTNVFLSFIKLQFKKMKQTARMDAPEGIISNRTLRRKKTNRPF